MKFYTPFFVAFLLLCTSVNAQTKQWLDENLKIQTAEKGAKYYQLVNKDGSYKVYLVNGTIYQEGKYTSFESQYANGMLTFYDENGKFIKKSEYVNGLEKPIPFYTGDIKQAYTYAGLVYQYETVMPIAGVDGYSAATTAGLSKLADKCRAIGSNGVINLRIEITALDDKSFRIALYGTAINM